MASQVPSTSSRKLDLLKMVKIEGGLKSNKFESRLSLGFAPLVYVI
jgi:hypothetical protein